MQFNNFIGTSRDEVIFQNVLGSTRTVVENRKNARPNQCKRP